MTEKFRSQTLKCGCCWEIFKTWEWYVDQDQDLGYWICRSCQQKEEDRNKDQYNKMFDLLYNAMWEEAKKKTDENIKKHWETRKVILVNWALEEKIIWFSIWK